LKLYGANNEARLTGYHETASFDRFGWGDGSRGESIRIPILTKNAGKGYLEDRRPAANIDPYLVSSVLVDITCLGYKYTQKLTQMLTDYINSTDANN
jgi:glutamine synthetase